MYKGLNILSVLIEKVIENTYKAGYTQNILTMHVGSQFIYT